MIENLFLGTPGNKRRLKLVVEESALDDLVNEK